MSNPVHTFRKMLQRWYIPIIIGILFIGLAAFIFAQPMRTMSLGMLLMGVLVLVLGVRSTVLTWNQKIDKERQWWPLASGVIHIILGLWIINKPLAAWAMVNNFGALFLIVNGLISAFSLIVSKNNIQNKRTTNWLQSLTQIFIGIALISRPQILGLFMVGLSGIPFLILGILLIAIGLYFRNTRNHLKTPKTHLHNENYEEATFEILENKNNI